MPSRHSSSSHSSHSSHSHSHSRSHSSSHSHHSSSSHSSSYSIFGTALYKPRSNQPMGYKDVASPKFYRCAKHDYVHYPKEWTDEKTGQKHRAGYYDEDGNFYEDMVFTENGKVKPDATAVIRCDYCRMRDSRPWADREKPCTHCGGTVTVITQVDEIKNRNSAVCTWYVENNQPFPNKKRANKKGCLTFLIILIGFWIFAYFIGENPTLDQWINGESSDSPVIEYSDSDQAVKYNIPELGNTMYLCGDSGKYTLTNQEDYQTNCENGSYKKLVLDSDGNYYEKSTDCYVWLNQDIDPPQFQYWYEGISSNYGDYGWMEYDEDEGKWYIEVSEGNWSTLDSKVYEANADRLWHIEFNLT